MDAWADDVQDEPLIALASTLGDAFNDFRSTTPEVQRGWERVLGQTGNIAKIIGAGLLRRGAGMLITSTAVEGVEAALSAADIDSGELSTALKEDRSGLLAEQARQAAAASYMQSRLTSFSDAKRSIVELKEGLSDLVASLEKAGATLPVIVFIDEIDRCRPSYAVKLFEEIKHVFDVDGVVFVFATNQRALSRSVAGVYGPDFDGWSYLRRFLNKTYRLSEPSLSPLVESLFKDHGLDDSRLLFPIVKTRQNQDFRLRSAVIISDYMKMYGKTARDAYAVVETLQTCLDITDTSPLLLGLLLPLILSSSDEHYEGRVIDPKSWNIPWSVLLSSGPISAADYARQLNTYAGADQQGLWAEVSHERGDPVAHEIFTLGNQHGIQKVSLAHPSNYPRLLEAVARFD